MNKKFYYPVILALLAMLVALPDSALAAGKPISEWFLVSHAPEIERQPAVAYNSQRNEYLVVFYNDRPGRDDDDIRAERISKNGKRLGGIWVSAGLGAERRNPDVTYNPQLDQYLVVWQHDDPNNTQVNIRGQLLKYDAAGNLMKFGPEIWVNVAGSGGCSVNCYASKPAVAYANAARKYLVVWENKEAFNVSSDIFAQVLLENGARWSVTYPLARGAWGYSHSNPDVAYNRSGNGFLVVWEQLNKDSESVPVPHTDIYGLIVDGGGPIVSSPLPIMSSSSYSEANPSVAAIPLVVVEGVQTKGQFLVAAEFYDPRDGRDASDIATILVNANGSLGGSGGYGGPGTPFILRNLFAPDINPVVAGSEGLNQFLLIWSTYFGERYPVPTLWGQTFDTLTGAPHGNIEPLGAPFPTYPAVASGSSGDFLVTTTIPGDWEIFGSLWGIP
ncbi:MAG: hypothetical protein AB1894_05685 [Chloroflexota bacterium]